MNMQQLKEGMEAGPEAAEGQEPAKAPKATEKRARLFKERE
jgi:hypothetical protein